MEALRIVHVVRSARFAGVERSILLSAEALTDRGHEVSVIGGEPKTMSASLAAVGVPWRPASSMSGAARELWRHGRVDIVHAHMTAAETAALPNRIRNRGKLVVTRHFGQRRGLSRPGGLAARVIDLVPHVEIAISRYVQSTIGVPSTIVHHGIPDTSAVDHLASKRVLVVQRLEAEKSTDVALRAWARSGLGDEGWNLLVAGDGADRSTLEALARAEGIDASVSFLGHVGDVDALRATAAMQLATPPHEHFGLSVLEAMSRGLPVVAADGGAHRELLGDDYPALFPPGDAKAASVCLRELVDDRQRRCELSQKLRRRQQEQFSLHAHGAALEAVYRQALGLTAGPITVDC